MTTPGATVCNCPFCHSTGPFTRKGTKIAGGLITVCDRCRGYFLDPPVVVAYEESGWSSMREEQWERDVARGKSYARKICQWFFDTTGKPLETVLEVGCGSAFMGPGFSDMGMSYSGIDVDGASVERAMDKGLCVHRVSAEELGESDVGRKKYDLVLSSNAMEHVFEPMTAFRSLSQCIGNLAVIIVPNPEGLLPRAKSNPLVLKAIQKFLGNKREIAYTIDGYWHNIAYSRQTLQYICSASGLQSQELRTIDINDDTFGFVQPNHSLAYRLATRVSQVLDMHSQLLLVAKPEVD